MDSASSSAQTRGLVYTFYSFKGGVGRSMALANVGALLSKWGKRVLIVDWDLEAPGIEKYFGRWVDGRRTRTPGLIDLVTAFANDTKMSWRNCLLQARIPKGEPIAILHAGREDDHYNATLRAIDWERMFTQHAFGNELERWREEWIDAYDFVLVDSRTGITDIGGICTIHLPDVLVSLFTANEQSLDGVKETMMRARELHAQMPLQRKRLIVIPVPARDESASEFKLAAEWRARFATELAVFYADWIPRDDTALRVLDLLKIPYFAYWSFGERLPVVEEDLDNPKNLSFSYQLVARLILSRLDVRELAGGSQASEALAAQEEAERKRASEAAALRERALQESLEKEQARLEQLERDRADDVNLFVNTTWHGALIRRQVAATAALILGSASLLVGLFAPSSFFGTTAKPSTPTAAFFDAAFSIFLALGNAIGSVSALIWTGVLGYLIAGAAALFWGFRRLSGARAALHERGLFRARSVDYAGLSADDALRLLLERSKWLFPPTDASVPPPPTRLPAPGLQTPAPAPPPTSAITGHAGALLAPPSPAAPPGGPGTHGTMDVFIANRSSMITQAWLETFVPIFTGWLGELLGREARVYWNRRFDSSVDESFADALLRDAPGTKVFMPIVTPTYLNSPFVDSELEEIAAAGVQTTALWLQGDPDEFPFALSSSEISDFHEFLFVGEGFLRSDRYVELQTRVRELAEHVAEQLKPDRARPVLRK